MVNGLEFFEVMIEIKEISVGRNSLESISLPTTIWLEIFDGKIQTSFDLNLGIYGCVNFNTKNPTYSICNIEDLNEFFKKYHDNLNLDLLRLEIKNTKRWGLKPLFINGVNNVCFQIFIDQIKNYKLLVLFNCNGAHEIESLYIHGIWLI
jgi:hypothetical protein